MTTSDLLAVLRAERDDLRRDVDNLRIERDCLVSQSGELTRLVDDLRAFERDYRARLIAFHEGCLRDLTAGQS